MASGRQIFLADEIITELDTGRILSCKSSNSIGIFTQPTTDKAQETRFPRHCIPRNLITRKDKTPMPRMEQIIDFIGCRPLRSKHDLTHAYNNIRIYRDSVSDSTFTCHMGTFDCRLMQQGACNAPTTMMRAMNYLFREVKDQMI